ncbi:MAG: PTS sugar transporter subunit IIB [Faecousia sp.]
MRKVSSVILCASAMSSSIIVDALRKAAPAKGIDLTVNCYASLRYRTFDFGSVDIVLLAPQVKGQLTDIQKYAAEKGHGNIPFMVIPMREYGLAKGEAILNMILETLDK